MTPTFLQRCVDAYGSVRGLAASLARNERTLRRHLDGDWPMPPGYDAEVAQALQVRAQELRLQAEQCEALAAYLVNVWHQAPRQPPSAGKDDSAA